MQKKPVKRKQRDIGSELGRVALPITLAAVGIFAVLSLTVLFRIETVIIKGGSDYTTEEILTACEISGGENLIRTNMAKCAENIEKRLVYIEKAELKRRFPSALEINITPAVETVSAEYEEKFCLLSEGGKVLDITDAPVEGTIVIYGAQPAQILEDWEIEAEQAQTSQTSTTETTGEPQEQEEDLSHYPAIGEKFACADDYRTEVFYMLLDTAAYAFSEKTNHYDMTDYINISCLYDNRITINFGSTGDFEYKIKLAENIITTKIGPQTEGTLKMLDKGASFIDKAGLEHNEQVYHNNINPAASETAAEDMEATSEESESAVNFE